jgi:FKBP-type peptidyl-prolyl cis-trans isomerase
MSRGQKSKLTVPSALAFGREGYPPVIPPNATVVYEIELVSFSSIGTANLSELFPRGTG